MLPLQATPELAQTLDEAAAKCPIPQLAQLRTACEQAREAVESGTGSKAELLRAEIDYELTLYWNLGSMGLPEADKAREHLRSLLKARSEVLVEMAQQLYQRGLAHHAEVLDARQICITVQHHCKAKPREELQEELLQLTQEAETYWAHQLEGAVVDRLHANNKLISLLVLQVGAFKLPATERLLALAAENVSIMERRYKAGQANATDLEDERRRLKWLQILCRECPMMP